MIIFQKILELSVSAEWFKAGVIWWDPYWHIAAGLGTRSRCYFHIRWPRCDLFDFTVYLFLQYIQMPSRRHTWSQRRSITDGRFKFSGGIILEWLVLWISYCYIFAMLEKLLLSQLCHSNDILFSLPQSVIILSSASSPSSNQSISITREGSHLIEFYWSLSRLQLSWVENKA